METLPSQAPQSDPDLAETDPAQGARDSEPVTSPERIGRFALLSKLGQGGMGVVYSAYDEELDRRVAIKVLARSDERATVRMRREAQAMARISHPNVAQVYEVGNWNGQVYIAIEFIRGVTLGEWLRGTDRSTADTLDVLIQAAEGLAAAHDVGLVHRDFKPENVMIGSDGRVRVLDFGLAGLSSADAEGTASSSMMGTSDIPADHNDLNTPLTQTGALMGTPAYMSPEQWQGSRVSSRSDVFSFCVVAYEALLGTRPFSGSSVFKLGISVCNAPPAPAPKDAAVSDAVLAALVQGLAKSPADRPKSIRDCIDVFRTALPRRGSFLESSNFSAVAAASTMWSLLVLIPGIFFDQHFRGRPDFSETSLMIVASVVVGAALALLMRQLSKVVEKTEQGRTELQLEVASAGTVLLLSGLAAFLLNQTFLGGTPLPQRVGIISYLLLAPALSTWGMLRLQLPLLMSARTTGEALSWIVLGQLAVVYLLDGFAVFIGLWEDHLTQGVAYLCFPLTITGALARNWIPDSAPIAPSGPRRRALVLLWLLVAAALSAVTTLA